MSRPTPIRRLNVYFFRHPPHRRRCSTRPTFRNDGISPSYKGTRYEIFFCTSTPCGEDRAKGTGRACGERLLFYFPKRIHLEIVLSISPNEAMGRTYAPLYSPTRIGDTKLPCRFSLRHCELPPLTMRVLQWSLAGTPAFSRRRRTDAACMLLVSSVPVASNEPLILMGGDNENDRAH